MSTKTNTGAFPRLALKAAQKLGIPCEAFWPESKRWHEQPDSKAVCGAYIFRDLKYTRLYNVDQVRYAIASRLPVVIGLEIEEGFVKDSEGKRIHEAPETNADVLGRHMVTITGYDSGCFKIRNSWGENWGDGGDGKLSVKYVTNALKGDCYAIE
jgi:hypothetical protein